MKTNELKRLRDKYCIKSNEIDIIKTVYSIKGLDSYPINGDPTDAKFYTWDYKIAENKQRELILGEVKKLRGRKRKISSFKKQWDIIMWARFGHNKQKN